MPIRHRIQSTLTELIAALVIAALIVVIPTPLLAQQKATPATVHVAKPVVADEEEESAAASKKPGDGIKVHGHWIIDVRDKDGKLVEHRDFQNALQSNGAGTLGLLLTGQAVPDKLFIVVAGGTSNGYEIFASNSLEASACNIPSTGHCLSGMTETLVTGGAVTLSGQFQATVADTFTFVSTNSWLCVSKSTSTYFPDTVAPASCNASFQSQTPTTTTTPANGAIGPYVFTSKDLTASPSTPLSVAAGQSVSVTVTLSFS